jgi:hypothetical protein
MEGFSVAVEDQVRRNRFRLQAARDVKHRDTFMKT